MRHLANEMAISITIMSCLNEFLLKGFQQPAPLNAGLGLVQHCRNYVCGTITCTSIALASGSKNLSPYIHVQHPVATGAKLIQ